MKDFNAFLLCHKAALNNEIMRLIWASYKEGYLTENGDVFFTVLNTQTDDISKIASRQEALRFQYNQYFKGYFEITGHFASESVYFETTRAFFERILPELRKKFPDDGFSSVQWEKLLLVSQDAVQNETAAIMDKQFLDLRIAEAGSLFDFGLNLTPNQSFIFFCRYAAYFGRFDMPFSKMKLPIEKKQALLYSPEFGNEVRLLLTALHRDYAFVNAPEADPNMLIAQENPQVHAKWESMLASRGLTPDDYLMLPVHPLSLDLYRQRLSSLIEADSFIIDERLFLPTKAGLSYRTVIPDKKSSGLVYKLPVPMQLTGYMRFICWGEISKSPQFSRILSKIFEEEEDFEGRLSLDSDVAAFSVRPGATRNICSNDPNYMSCIIRENQSRNIPDGYMTMPLAMLFASSSKENTPMLIQAMRRSGAYSKDQAIEYFNSYLDLTLRSLLTLYLRNGLMLEAHQQNMGITLKPDGSLYKLHYHDIAFAVHTYSKVYIAAGHNPELLDGLPCVTDQVTRSARHFISCVLMVNLFPLASTVAYHFSIEERFLLKLVADEILNILEEERQTLWKKSKDLQKIFESFYNGLEKRILRVSKFDSARPLGRFFRVSQIPVWGEVPSKDDIAFNAIRMTGCRTPNPLVGLTSINDAD